MPSELTRSRHVNMKTRKRCGKLHLNKTQADTFQILNLARYRTGRMECLRPGFVCLDTAVMCLDWQAGNKAHLLIWQTRPDTRYECQCCLRLRRENNCGLYVCTFSQDKEDRMRNLMHSWFRFDSRLSEYLICFVQIYVFTT